MKLDLVIETSSEESLRKGCLQVLHHLRPQWDPDQVSIKYYTEGRTNKLVGIWNNDRDNQIMIRVCGEGTDLFIDREKEIANVKVLQENGFDSEIYVEFENGFSYKYIPGDMLSTTSVTRKEIYSNVAYYMAGIHKIKIGTCESQVFQHLQKYLDLLPDDLCKKEKKRLNDGKITKSYLIDEISALKSHIQASPCDVVFCHNDLSVKNIVWNDKSQTIHFIDHEYSFPNYQYFDIANHFCEFADGDEVDYSLYPSKEFMREWLRSYLSHYLKKDSSSIDASYVEEVRKDVNKFALLSHLFWAVWAILQANVSDIDYDFFEYGLERIQEYRVKKDAYLSGA